jgi:MFS family permease
MLNYLDRTMITTMRESIVSAVPMTDTQFGLLTSVFLWVYGLLSPFAGFMADRFKKKYVIIGSLFVWSGVTWLTGHARTFEELLATRALMGISEAFYIPAALSLIMDYHKGPTRSLATGMHIAGAMMGSSLGVLGGWIAEQYTWNSAFNLFGLIGIAYSVFLIMMLKEPEEKSFIKNKKDVISSATTANNIRFTDAIKALFSKRAFIYLLLLWCMTSIVSWMVTGWLPTYYKEHFHLSQTVAGLYATTYLYPASILGLIAAGICADKWSKTNPYARVLVPIIALCIAAPCVFLSSYTNILWLAICFFMIYALVRMAVDTNLMPVLCMVVDGRYRATGYGILNMLATIVGGIGIFAAGMLRDSDVNLGLIFQYASICIVLCVVCLFLVKFQMKKNKIDETE